jgi:hypothetical protein
MKLGQHLRCKCENILRSICSLLNNFNFLQSTRYINNLWGLLFSSYLRRRPDDRQSETNSEKENVKCKIKNKMYCIWHQCSRRLEGWPNRAACLASWRRVTRRGDFVCTWRTRRTACLFRTVPVDMTGAGPATSWWNYQLLLYNKCTQPSVMIYVTQGRHGLVL